MNNFIEELRNHIQKNPEINAISGDLITLAEEHPEWNKLSDFPPFNSFPAVDWGNNEILRIISNSVLQNITLEMNNYFTSLKKGTEFSFIVNLIRNFAVCKCTANALQTKFDIQDDPRYKEEIFKQNTYSRVIDRN